MKRLLTLVAAGLSLIVIPLAAAAPTQIDGAQINRLWRLGTVNQTGLNIIGASGQHSLPAFKVYHPGGGLSVEQKVNGRLTITGGLLINLGGRGGSGVTIDPGLAVEIIGTASGRVLHAQDALTSSGGLRINGVLTGATALYGAGLGDCDDATTSKLAYDSSTGRFSCGTDTAGTANAITGTGAGSATSGKVAFFNGVRTLSGSEMFWDEANERLGVRTSSPQNPVHVVGPTGNATTDIPLRFDRVTPSTNIQISSMIGIAITTGGAMADGFGSLLRFEVQDDEGVNNLIARIGASRRGRDNSGRFTILTTNSGSETVKMIIEPGGNTGIGPSINAAKARLHVIGSGAFTGSLSGASLRVMGTMSGQALVVTGTGSAPTLATFTGNKVGIGTSAPKTALEVIGTVSGSALATAGGATTINTTGNLSFTRLGTAAAPAISGGANTGIFFRDSARISFATSGTEKVEIVGSSFALVAATIFGWSPSTDPATAPDTAFQRASAGVLHLTDGSNAVATASRLRDLRLRNLTASGNILLSEKTGLVTAKARLHVVGSGAFTKSMSGNNLYVQSGGYVLGRLGVGTNTPGALLDIGGFGSSPVAVTSPVTVIAGDTDGISGVEMKNVNAGTSADFRFAISDPSDTSYLAFSLPGSNHSSTLFGLNRASTAFLFTNDNGTNERDLAIGTVKSNALVFGTTNVERMRILAGGNVGIATTTPKARLHVIGSGAFTGSLSGASLRVMGTMSGRSLVVTGTGSTPLLTTSVATGRVGIGTASPLDPLHILSGTNSDIYLGSTTNNAGEHQIGFGFHTANSHAVAIAGKATGAGGRGVLEFRVAAGSDATNATTTDTVLRLKVNEVEILQPITYAQDTLSIGNNYNSGVKAFKFTRTENKAAIWSVPEGSHGRGDLRFTTGNALVSTAKAETDAVVRIGSNGGVVIGNSYIGSNPNDGTLIVSANVGIGTTNPKGKIHVVGSGAFTSSLSGASLDIQGAVRMRSLISCTALQTDSNGALSCGAGGTGISQTSGDARYVNTAGDTMTGALRINWNGSASGQTLLNVKGGLSGASLVVSGGLNSINGPTTMSGQTTIRSARICRQMVLTNNDPITSASTGTGGFAAVRVPPLLHRATLSGAWIYATNAGTTGLSQMQVKNYTQGNYLFSTPIALGSGRTSSGAYTASATPYVFNEGDVIAAWVSAVAGTPPKGLSVEIQLCP